MIDYNGVSIRKIHTGNKFIYTADLGAGVTFSSDTMEDLKSQIDSKLREQRWIRKPIVDEE